MQKTVLILFLLLISVNFAFGSNTGIEQLTKAANKGNAEAQFSLGVCYDNGDGVARDYKQAVYWFRKAAGQEIAAAQFNLGNAYYNGQGVARDYKQAADWFRKAAEQGYAAAQFNLGVCYANGEGVPKDYKQAYMWLSLSLAQTTDAEEMRTIKGAIEMLESNMTKAQIAEARDMTAEWLKKH